MTNKLKKPSTQLEHLGRASADHFGSVNMPTYRVSTALFPTLESFRAQSQKMTYGRRATPSSEALCDTIATLEGGSHCMLTPSGLSAVSCAILSSVKSGGHILISDGVYDPTRAFCDDILPQFNIRASYYDPTDIEALAEAFTPETQAVFTESPSSLTFEMQDIPAISALAHQHGARVILDNTWATPLFFKPFDKGVDISIQAATKYLCGHADLLLGTLTTNQSAYVDCARMHRRLGLCASGDDIYLTLRGLRTLEVRLERHQATAIKLAEFLAQRDEVAEVIHPALPSHPQHIIWQRDFLGASGLFAFRLKPVSEAQLAKMFDGFELFAMGYSWGGFESLIIPAEPTRTAQTPDNTNPLVRIHAGLEDEDDLIEDLQEGLERLGL